MRRTLSVKKNADRTLTIRASAQGSSYVEHFTLDSKGPYEVFEAAKWSLITAGFSVDEEELAEMVRVALVEGA